MIFKKHRYEIKKIFDQIKKKKSYQSLEIFSRHFEKNLTKFWKKKLAKIMKKIWLKYFEHNLTYLFCRKFDEIFVFIPNFI